MAFTYKIIEQTALNTRHEPIKPTAPIRLAFGWQAYTGISKSWRTELFWRTLGIVTHTGPHSQMMRDRDFALCLNGWRRQLGLLYKND